MALEAWDETCSVLVRLGPDAPSSSSSSSSWLEVSSFDAVARRGRQVERIVEASIVSRVFVSAGRSALTNLIVYQHLFLASQQMLWIRCIFLRKSKQSGLALYRVGRL